MPLMLAAAFLMVSIVLIRFILSRVRLAASRSVGRNRAMLDFASAGLDAVSVLLITTIVSLSILIAIIFVQIRFGIVGEQAVEQLVKRSAAWSEISEKLGIWFGFVAGVISTIVILLLSWFGRRGPSLSSTKWLRLFGPWGFGTLRGIRKAFGATAIALFVCSLLTVESHDAAGILLYKAIEFQLSRSREASILSRLPAPDYQTPRSAISSNSAQALAQRLVYQQLSQDADSNSRLAVRYVEWSNRSRERSIAGSQFKSPRGGRPPGDSPPTDRTPPPPPQDPNRPSDPFQDTPDEATARLASRINECGESCVIEVAAVVRDANADLHREFGAATVDLLLDVIGVSNLSGAKNSFLGKIFEQFVFDPMKAQLASAYTRVAVNAEKRIAERTAAMKPIVTEPVRLPQEQAPKLPSRFPTPRPSPSLEFGQCECVTVRNGVPVSTRLIPYGATCGHQICGRNR